ncbi:hypothetical protein OQA88_5777 [Cercophora sp. LCS_1]
MEPRKVGGDGTTSTPLTTTPTQSAVVPSKDPEEGGFSGLAKELNDQLEVTKQAVTGLKERVLLKAKDAAKQYLPGQPRARLHVLAQDHRPEHNTLLGYLRKAHLTDGLDELLPYMRYIFVQTPSYKHIMPLHHQQARKREIMVNEEPGLHLVWYYERIFIKPIPAYFYSQAFWTYLKDAEPAVFKAAVGFMRSYGFLIQYEIDFDEGVSKHLIPKKPDGHFPTYEEFCDFIEPFTHVDDKHVSRRFHYGELRLTRINRTAFFFKGRLAYFHIHLQWGSFLEHILAPIITVFAVFSVVLNSMQVSLAALDMETVNNENGWPSFISISLWFPISIIISIAIVLLIAVAGISIMGVKDFLHGNKVRRRRKRDVDTDEKSHGMVW